MSSTTHLDRTNGQLLSDTMLLRLQQAEPAFVASLRNLACERQAGRLPRLRTCGLHCVEIKYASHHWPSSRR